MFRISSSPVSSGGRPANVNGPWPSRHASPGGAVNIFMLGSSGALFGAVREVVLDDDHALAADGEAQQLVSQAADGERYAQREVATCRLHRGLQPQIDRRKLLNPNVVQTHVERAVDARRGVNVVWGRNPDARQDGLFSRVILRCPSG